MEDAGLGVKYELEMDALMSSFMDAVVRCSSPLGGCNGVSRYVLWSEVVRVSYY